MNKPHSNISEIVKGGGRFDIHCWVEDEDGKIHDYEDDVLNTLSTYGKKGTKHKRVPLSKELQLEFLPHYTKSVSHTSKVLKQLTQAQQDIYFNRMMNMGGLCLYRAYTMKGYLKSGENKKSKIVFGSLGYIQPNGDVFYEYG